VPLTTAGTPLRVPRLHVITDVVLQRRHDHLALTLAAIAGGADLVQLRDKQATDEEIEPIARAMLQRCRARGALCLLNDRVGLAARLHADGAHVGAEDMAPAAARGLLGPQALLGATANDLSTALALAAAPIDYLGVGPVFGTRSKARPAPTLGLEGLAAICRAVTVPVIAIGGITADRIAEVLAAGAHGIAVLGAVAHAPDPAAATAALREALDRAVSEAADA
jgi:thiamine-phosphate pyrophosphorylase